VHEDAVESAIPPSRIFSGATDIVGKAADVERKICRAISAR
jgi:hypothetical protein